MQRNVPILLVILLSALLFIAWLDPLRDMVSEGNGFYHQKKYNEAKGSYTKAEKYTTSDEQRKKIDFNQANAGHMLEEYEKAIAHYSKALQSQDRDVQKQAFFNLGNTYVKMEDYEKAVKAYINALQIDPNYEKAKKNLEYLLLDKKNDQKKNKDKKNKDDKQNKDKNKDKQKQDPKQSVKKLNREQIKNILNSMKTKPVRRQKGKGLNKDAYDKNW